MIRRLALAAMLAAIAMGPASAAAPDPPRFKDATAALGLSLSTDAACWVDIDNDGWTDLVTGSGVWRNEAGKRFVKVFDCPDAVAADYDNDGYADLFSWSSLKLFHNNAGKGFTEAKLPALATSSRGACWADLNGDGYSDLYIGGYEDWDRDITYPSLVLINEKGAGFRVAATDARYRARGVTACDFNRDGAPDIYVSDYRLQPNQLLLNDGTGKLTDVAPRYGAVATSPGFDGGHSIGACWGDFDGDGEFDIFAGNFAHVDSRGDQPKSRFLQSLGKLGEWHFKDLGPCGVFYQESYATPAAGDYDNDGQLDLIFTAVYGVASFGRPNYPVLYHNQGKFVFADDTAAAGVAGLPPTYQAAWADYDHDGRLDLICGGKLFHNEGPAGHWLEVRLEGDGVIVNRSAVGAQVRIKLKDRVLARQVEAGTGEGNQNDLTLHFGLGEHKGRVDLQIEWPGGRKQTVRGVRADTLIARTYKPRRGEIRKPLR